MIVVMSVNASAREISDVIARIRAMGYDVHLSEGKERTIIGVIGRGRPLDREQLAMMDGVYSVMPVTHPYKIASREYHPDDTIIPLAGSEVGGTNLALIAGPCSVESREHRSSKRRTPSAKPGRRLCAEGHSSRARRRTASRGWARRDCVTWPKPAR